jgi:hypothetical protein
VNLVSLEIQTSYPVLDKPSLVDLTRKEFDTFVQEQQHLNNNPKEHELYELVQGLVKQAVLNVGIENEAYVGWDGEWHSDGYKKKLETKIKEQQLKEAQKVLDEQAIVREAEKQEQERQQPIHLRNNARPFCNHFHFKNIGDSIKDLKHGTPPKAGANKHLVQHHSKEYWNASINQYDITQCAGCDTAVNCDRSFAFCKNCETWEQRFPHPDTRKNADEVLILPGNFGDGRILYCTTCLPLAKRKRKRTAGETWNIGEKSVVVNDPVLNGDGSGGGSSNKDETGGDKEVDENEVLPKTSFVR